MEDFLGCVQCYASLRTHWWENIVYAWWNKPTAGKFLTNSQDCETSWNPRPRLALWLTVGGSWERNVRMELKWKRSQLRFRFWYCGSIPNWPWYRSYLPRPSGCRRRIWILCQKTTCDSVQCTQLLWRILKFWSHDECWLVTNVLVSDSQGNKKKEMIILKSSLIFSNLFLKSIDPFSTLYFVEIELFVTVNEVSVLHIARTCINSLNKDIFTVNLSNLSRPPPHDEQVGIAPRSFPSAHL